MTDVPRRCRAPASVLVAREADSEDGEEDADLVALAQRDRAAFALLYRRYVDPIYRFCYRRLGHRESAEDATSLVFTRALQALPRYRAGSFRAWLFTIAQHVVTDMQRAGRPVSSINHDRVIEEIVDAAVTPEERALAGDQARSIRTLLAQLPPDQRQLMELRLAGLTDAEIARVLGRSHGSVRTAQYRALSRLRSLMGVGTTPGDDRP